MVRYGLAVTLLLSAGVSGFAPRGGVRWIDARKFASTSTCFNDDSEDRSIEELRKDVKELGSAYFESLSRAVTEDEVDEYEVEMETKKKRKQEQNRTYQVTLPLVQPKGGVTKPLGMTMCQVDSGFVFSDVDLELDSLQFLTSADGSVMEKYETLDVSDMKKPLNRNFQGVVVSGVLKGGLAWEAGVRPGDVLRSTSATLGNAQWPKSSLNGVKSAMSSRKLTAADMTFQFERISVEELSRYELTLTKPLGLQIQATEDGNVEVTGFTANAQRLARYAIYPGDRILAVDAAVGDRMWPVSTVEGVISACTSRLPGQPIRMLFGRPASYSSSDQTMTVSPDMSKTAAVPQPLADKKSKTANNVLLGRCRETLRRYSVEGQTNERATFSGKYAVPSLVADKVLDAVASASASLDSVTLSMVMKAFLSCRQPDKAIRAFETAVGLKADGSDELVKEMISAKGGGFLVASSDALNLVSGSSLMQAHALKGDFDSAYRVLLAMKGRAGVKVGAVESGNWPGTGAGGAIHPDTQCYNIALSAAAKSGRSDAVDEALILFNEMTNPRNFGTKPVKDLVSYNTIIRALAKQDRPSEAFSVLYDMKKAGVRPDKFTYTSLIPAFVNSGDLQELLYDMREQGIEEDVVTYNNMIRALCNRSQLTAAKELVNEMESRRITPNSMTYGLLMNGLLKAKKPSTCLTLFETACANPRTAPLTENVFLYTTAIAAASAIGDHERAFDLVSRMNASGVKPNLKTLTALVGACLSAGKNKLALDVYNKIEDPDGYAMEMAIKAMCGTGDLLSAGKLLSEQRSGTHKMKGKQIVASYQELIRSSLDQNEFALAKDTVTQFLGSGYIPSKSMLQTIVEALGLIVKPEAGLAQSGLPADQIKPQKFDFLLFVLDSMQARNLACDGHFYASVLSCGAHMGGLHRKIASLMVKSRAATVEKSGVIGVDSVAVKTRTWQELLNHYDDAKKQFGSEAQLPLLSVRTSRRDLHQVLAAEKRASYGSSVRPRKRRIQKLAYKEKTEA